MTKLTVTSLDLKPGDKVRLKDGPHLQRMAAKAGATGTVGQRNIYSLLYFKNLLFNVIWDNGPLRNGQENGEYVADNFELINETISQPITKIDYMQITRDMCGRR